MVGLDPPLTRPDRGDPGPGRRAWREAVTTRPNPAIRRSPARDRDSVPTGLPSHLRLARDHLDRRYRSAIDRDQVAAVAGVSEYRFVRGRVHLRADPDPLPQPPTTVDCRTDGVASPYGVEAVPDRDQTVIAAVPKATLNRSHQMTTEFSPDRSTSAGIS